jgi:hypothetical protein
VAVGKKRVHTKEKYKLRLTTKAYKLSYNYINYTINLVGRSFGGWRRSIGRGFSLNVYWLLISCCGKRGNKIQYFTDVRHVNSDRLCGLVVRVLDYRCRGPRFDSRALQKK